MSDEINLEFCMWLHQNFNELVEYLNDPTRPKVQESKEISSPEENVPSRLSERSSGQPTQTDVQPVDEKPREANSISVTGGPFSYGDLSEGQVTAEYIKELSRKSSKSRKKG
jgi:hypothetical protein